MSEMSCTRSRGIATEARPPWRRTCSRFLAGRSILARPAGRIEQALKWTLRRPALTAALCALALVTALGIGGIFRQWLQTQDALADEATARQRAEYLRVQAQDAQQAEAGAREKSEIALVHHRVVLAHREWLAANIGRASQLLNECRVDLRGWEWRDASPPVRQRSVHAARAFGPGQQGGL